MTRRLVGGLFDLEDLGLQQLAGFAEPQRLRDQAVRRYPDSEALEISRKAGVSRPAVALATIGDDRSKGAPITARSSWLDAAVK